MNIKQFQIMEEIMNISRQMVYEQYEEVELDCQYMRNKITYIRNLIMDFDKEEEKRWGD